MGQRTVYVNATLDVEMRPPRDRRRTYLFIQNQSAASIYYSEGTLADPNISLEIGAGQWQELSENLGQAVPQGNCWLRGASAPPTQQRVVIKEN